MMRIWEGAACTDLQQGCQREWLLPNGAGGYASQSLLGVSTRAQHSLLMAQAPDGSLRSLLARLEDSFAGQPLSTNQYPNAFWPRGYASLVRISLDPAPTWVFSLGEHLIAKRIEVAQNRSATRVTYYLLAGEPAQLKIKPLFAFRGQGELRRKQDGVEYSFAYFRSTLNVLPEGEPLPCILHLGAAQFIASPDWFFHFVYEREREANLPHEEDLFTPGEITIELTQEQPYSFWAIADLAPPPTIDITPVIKLPSKQQELPLFSGPLLIARQIARRKTLIKLREQLSQASSRFLQLTPNREQLSDSLDAPSKELWPRLLALPGLCIGAGQTQSGALLLQKLLEGVTEERDLLLAVWAASMLPAQIKGAEGLLLSMQRRLDVFLGALDELEARVIQDAQLAGLWHWALSWLSRSAEPARATQLQALRERLVVKREQLTIKEAKDLWALATPQPLWSGQEARPLIDRLRAALLTPRGLREDGQISPWRLGVYCDAYLNAYGDNNASAREHVEQCLLALSSHLEDEAGVGFISAAFEDNAAYTPRGALSFAPSIAEPLRVLERLGIKD